MRGCTTVTCGTVVTVRTWLVTTAGAQLLVPQYDAALAVDAGIAHASAVPAKAKTPNDLPDIFFVIVVILLSLFIAAPREIRPMVKAECTFPIRKR